MVCLASMRVPIFFALLFITYWAVFFGHELLQTLLLYQSASSIYHIFDLVQLQNHEQPAVSHLRQRTVRNTSHLQLPIQNTTSTSQSFANATTIPLILHRMWRDQVIPKQWLSSYHQCEKIYKKRNWTTILWTDATIRSFIAEHYSYFLPVYDSYWYNIQRVDAARYFILYHYGGVYLDLDIGCRANKDSTDLVRAMDLMKADSMFPLTNPMGMSNDVMFASKGNVFLKELIEALPTRNKWYGLPYLTVLFSTGPMFLSLVYMNYPSAKEEVLALSTELYSETDGKFFCHLQGSTWHSSDAHAIEWLIRNWSSAVLVLISVVVLFRMQNKKNSSKETKPHRLSQ